MNMRGHYFGRVIPPRPQMDPLLLTESILNRLQEKILFAPPPPNLNVASQPRNPTAPNLEAEQDVFRPCTAAVSFWIPLSTKQKGGGAVSAL